MKRHWIAIFMISLILVSTAACGQIESAGQQVRATQAVPTALPSPSVNPAQQSPYLETFDAVWQGVSDVSIRNELFFDPTFGGKDWEAVGARYRPQMIGVLDEVDALMLLNQMLFELGVSHIAALPISMANQLEPISTSPGWAGVDGRFLGDLFVLTDVAAGTSADLAGLRPGFMITAVDNYSVQDIADIGLQTPPDNERNRIANKSQKVRQVFYGEVGKSIQITYLDEHDEEHQAILTLEKRPGKMDASVEGLPPMNSEVEAYQLQKNITYLRFSAFLPSVLDDVLAAIDQYIDSPAMIIDLRGNPGGVFPIRKAIAEKLVGDPVVFFRYQKRDGVENVYLKHLVDPYKGQIVLLVDELSASSSEEFSGGMQSIGRARMYPSATIIGRQTPGRCLAADILKMPSDFILMVPTRQSQTPDGHILEDNGVIPDIAVPLTREELLQGIDAPLRAAIDFIMGGK